MDKKAFKLACEKVLQNERTRNGIGTLSEKTLHAILKHYMEPDEQYHEIKKKPYVADVLKDDQIIEIQTGNFNVMRKKLECFLADSKVTVVYPIPSTKWISWIDEETGEVTSKRKSPKRGTPYMAFRELYRIKPFLSHANFNFMIIMMDVEESRLLNGWSKDRKKGSVRNDRIPTDIVEELYFERVEDYRMLVPPQLENPFTSAEYGKATKLSRSQAQTALNILHSLNVVERIGKTGNSYLYQVES